MKTFSVHTREKTPLVLVPERFSWGAALFGPLWLLAHRARIAAALALLAGLAAAAAPPPFRLPLSLALAALLGFCGHDCRRWTLARRGFSLAQIVAAASADAALARLLDARPDLLAAAS